MDEPLRIGIYGISSSGKTCLLTALAMGRTTDPRGFGCIPVALTAPAEAKDNARAEAIRRGLEWRDEAIASLSSGGLPKATGIVDVGKQAALFEFDFFAPGRQTFRAEMIDYSGELADAAHSKDQLAEGLREHLREMDALVVIADAPLSNTWDDGHFQGLKRLSAALTLLRQPQRGKKALKFTLPVAFLVSKWDREGCPSRDNPEADDQRLRALLNPGNDATHNQIDQRWSAHTQIFRFLSDSFQHCSAFPVSAFGEAKTVRTQDNGHSGSMEVPIRTEPLPSFNVESPFIWCADIIEENAFRTLEKRLRKRLNPWPIHHSAAFTRLNGRTPPDSDMGRRLADLTRRSRRRTKWLLPIWFVVSFVILAMLQYWGYDRRLIQKYTAVLRSTESTDQQIADARHQIGSIIQNLILHPTAWFLDATAEAQRHVEEWIAKKDDEFDQNLSLTQDIRNRAEIGRAYVAMQPNGKRLPKANNEIHRWEAEQARIEQEKQNSETRRVYESYMESDQWAEAAKRVLGPPVQPELRKDFTARAPVRLADEVNRLISGSEFEKARNLLRQFEGPPERVFNQTPGSVINLSRMRREVNVAEDKQLYRMVQVYRDTNRCNAYLNATHMPGAMRRYVAAFKTHIEGIENEEHNLSFVIRSIRWEKWDNNIGIKVLINGNILIDQKGIEAETGQTTQPNLTAPFKAKLKDMLEVQVDLTDLGWPLIGWNASYGHLKFQATPAQLAGSMSRYTSGERKHLITMAVIGLPLEPPLPEYLEPE